MAKVKTASLADSPMFLKGSDYLPGKNRIGKFDYSKVSNGYDELSYDPNEKIPGDNPKNSERARSASKESFVDGCFCNKRGQ